jgi:hypothetical protein
MSVNRVGKGISISLLAVFACGMDLGCTADLPNGKIICGTVKDCPNGWSCGEDEFCWKPEKTETSGETVSSGNYGMDAGGCVAIDCQGRCGAFEGCFGTKNCGSCDNGFQCSTTGECVPECGGCYIDGVCHNPGFVNPQNPCEMCAPATSTSGWSRNDGAICDDGKFCTVSDKCVGKECKGETLSCDDGKSITSDTCSDAEARCVNICTCAAPQVCDFINNTCKVACDAKQCTIGQVCYDSGFRHATNPCQVCNAAVNAAAWSVDVGRVCGDSTADVCVGQSTCQASGACERTIASAGTKCGDTSQTECSAPDTCDGNGNCIGNHSGTDRACGSKPGVCENQRRCDGNGECGAAAYKAGTKCDTPNDTECSSGSFCDDSGQCVAQSNVGKPCGGVPGECEEQSRCNASGRCAQVFKPSNTSCGSDSEDQDGCVIYRCNGRGGCKASYTSGSCETSTNVEPEEASCGGTRLFDLCWYLASANVSCNQHCAKHGGYNQETARYTGTSAQGGSLAECSEILKALGRPSQVTEGERSDSGFGCHVWNSQDAWWLSSPAFDPAAAYTDVSIVCACNQ